ncbi:MAG: polysaccharide deacetylase family protein [Patescibacteria group bacterium]|nr:polysaccharide deacetylase family protein [Patescibacteria group bacterium]
MLLTTSWDDGYELDLELAEVLEEYNCTGTFYVCPKKTKKAPKLTENDIYILSKKHEIGAHGMTHSWLPSLPPVDIEREIVQSKQWVENITGKECTMFCYPYGAHNEYARRYVKKAGFLGARTVEILQFSAENKFVMPTTLQIAPFPKRKEFKIWWHKLDTFGPLRTKMTRLFELHIPLRSMKSWLELAAALLAHAIETKQPFFHLWGHSDEIERYEMWEELEKFLEFANIQEVKCVTNSELVSSLNSEKQRNASHSSESSTSQSP